jgi:Asp-tRNA(Asn)/Glu-tRNA(Gln) amidotransferase A subunit family amidase
MARTVTDAARLLGVLAGFDGKDPATAPCRKRGNCFRDYTQFLNAMPCKAHRGATASYWSRFGLGAARTALMGTPSPP